MIRDTRPVYPPDYDEPCVCAVCGRDAEQEADEGGCDCPPCPGCGSVGDEHCYEEHEAPPAHDSVQSFLDHIGIAPLWTALRAIDKHNVEHVWLVLRSGEERERLYYHSAREQIESVPVWRRLDAVGVGGIAWDGSDWEWSSEVAAGNGWADLDAAREEFGKALDDWTAEQEAERGEAE